MAIPTLQETQLMHRTVCHAVADPRRIQILYALHEQPQNVTSLAKLLNIPQPTLSRHLSLLRQRSLVTAMRDGASVIYSLNNPELINVLDTMRTILRQSIDYQDALMNEPDLIEED